MIDTKQVVTPDTPNAENMPEVRPGAITKTEKETGVVRRKFPAWLLKVLVVLPLIVLASCFLASKLNPDVSFGIRFAVCAAVVSLVVCFFYGSYRQFATN